MVHASYVCHDVRIIREQAADRTLLTNARADYLLLGAPNASNYDGLFVRWNEKEMRKILWNVLPKGTLRSVEIDGKSITRTFDGAKHTFAFDEEGALFSCEGDHTLTLDCKRLYDESDTQRIYDMRAVRMADDHAIDRSLARIAVFDVLYRKGDEYSIPVCIATTMRASPIGSWRSVEYAYDKRRGTQSTTWVFDALSLEGSGLVAIAAHQDPKRAHNAAVTLLLRERTLFAAKERATHLMPLVQLGVRALHALQTQHGIVAGLPWFYRTWSRDELIAAGGLLATGELDEVADILERWFGAVRQDGTLPAIFPDEGLVSADAPGWLGVRTRELLEHDPQLRIVPCERAARWCAASERMLLAMRAHHTRNGLVFSASKTTWMDTDDGGDGRTGMCIEIQALTFALVRAHILLCKRAGISCAQWDSFSDELLQAMRSRLVQGGIIVDGIRENGSVDTTVRPNVFLAWYPAKEAFSQELWRSTFSHALRALWLDWGALSSIGTSHPSFCQWDEGENTKAYHRGDVWFFVNNIAAMALHDVGGFAPQVRVLLRSSVRDLLDQGILGCASEISSAARQEAMGCHAQAWSASTLVEALLRTNLSQDDLLL